MNKESTIKSIIFITATLAMITSFQNCGKMKPEDNVDPIEDVIHAERPTQDANETKILDSVLSNYSSCDSTGDDVHKCRRAALESSAGVAQKTTIENNDMVCYVFGPGCKSTAKDPSFSAAMAVQSCRSTVSQEGLAFSTLNTLMSKDPVGYAEMINGRCLYDRYKCVIAVRCVSKRDVVIPGGNVSSSF